MKSREEIASILRNMIADGSLVSKVGTGLPYPEICRRIAKGEYLVTSCESVLATDRASRDLFEEWISEHRVMDSNMVRVHKDLPTLYAINKECADGKMLRFPDFGKMCPLFID